MSARPFSVISLAALAVGGTTVVIYFPFTVDDAYIVLRYARNLVTEGQLAFNLGEPVLAVTSPLHAVLTAAAYAVSGTGAVVLNKILMILFVVITAWLLVRRAPADGRNHAVVLTLLAASPFVWMWAVGGLETMLAMCVVTAIALLSPRAAEPATLRVISILAGVAFLVRYDTMLFVSPVLAAAWWMAWRRHGTRLLVQGMSLSAVLPAAWLVFSLVYFHDVVPTSFYAKASRDVSWFKLAYMGQFLLVTGVLPLGVVALARVWSAQAPRLPVLLWERAAAWSGLLLVFAYGSAHATVHMMFGYRLLLPYLPVLVLLVLELLEAGDRGARRSGRPDRAVAVLLGVWVIVQVGQGMAIRSRSLGGVGITGEFHAMGLDSYHSDFLPVMASGCHDLTTHARSIPRFDQRLPRFMTFAEGYIPFCNPDLYVYGHLVSYRESVNERWPPRSEVQRSADYIYVLTPRHGPLSTQLPLPVESFEPVSSHTIEYNGRPETFTIYFNQNPEDASLPTHVR